VTAFLLLALALQVRVDASTQRDTTDTARVRAGVTVSVRDGRERHREPRRAPVTAEHLRTAFRTPLARSLLTRARVARLSQDSALMSYEATTYFRISAGLGISKFGRDRLIFRHENVTHVKWHRDAGAWVDLTGARTHLPADVDEDGADWDSDMAPLPYYPGQEQLLSFNGSEVVKAQVDERDMVHPLAEGAEAYYTYAVGDSVTFRLPDGRSIELRELYVRPRQSKWNVAVGSLWFDVSSGQMVRAAYRLAVPMDVWAIVEEEDPTAQDDIPVWVKPMISPMRAQVSAIAVEYGLYQGRFWLPRLRSAQGDAQASFMRVPFKMEQSAKYSSVNALDSLPQIRLPERQEPPDSLSEDEADKWRDSVRDVRRERRAAVRDSIKAGLKAEITECDTASVRTVTRSVARGSNVRVATRIPCDFSKLASSPELPKSIFDEGEEVFGSKERDALIKEALSMGAQPPFAIGAIPPTLKYGFEFTRFNRVEGLSSGLLAEQRLGAGYTASLLGRLGTADLEPNVEIGLARSNLSRTIRGRLYNRLVSANDWGNPLSFGSSLSALLFGRDEGFYYRASGAELEWMHDLGTLFSWRLFAERQRTAEREVARALGHAFGPNVASRFGGYAGVSGRMIHSRGLDPNGFRVFSDVRLESAVSDSASSVYGRGALDLTITQGLGRVASAITMSAGSSAGPLPPQRQWFLGGAHTVRGQPADTASAGSAFWLGRLELGTAVQSVRPVIFGDIGWTGDRTGWREGVRPMSGVGIGASMLDGLFRFDLARGIHPTKSTRVYLYLDAKF
jgi:hypothetical protein